MSYNFTNPPFHHACVFYFTIKKRSEEFINSHSLRHDPWPMYNLLSSMYLGQKTLNRFLYKLGNSSVVLSSCIYMLWLLDHLTYTSKILTPILPQYLQPIPSCHTCDQNKRTLVYVTISCFRPCVVTSCHSINCVIYWFIRRNKRYPVLVSYIEPFQSPLSIFRLIVLPFISGTSLYFVLPY